MRAHRQRPGDRSALLLSTRETGRVVVGLVAHPDLGQHLHADLLSLPPAELPDHAQRFGHVAERRLVRPKVVVLEDHADDAADAVDVAFAVGHTFAIVLAVAEQPSFDEHPAFVVAVQKRHAAQQGALAGTGRADDAHHLRAVDRKVNSVQHMCRAEPLVQALDQDHRFIVHRALFPPAAHGAGLNRRSSAPPANAMPSMISQ